MKQITLVNAYNTMEQLAENSEFSEMEQWKLYQVRKVLRPHVEFYGERRFAITNQYQSKADDNGKLFGKDAEQYLADCKSLDELEIELEDYTKPSIRLVKGVSFKTVEQLEDFIEFTPPEDAA